MADFKVRLNPPTRDFTLKNTTITSNRLDALSDVNEPDGDKITGALLVYNAATDTYVLTADILQYDSTTDKYTVNGGSF